MPLRTITAIVFSWPVALFGGAGAIPLVAQLGLPPVYEGCLQFGALGILAYAVHRLFRELAAQRTTAKQERDSHLEVLSRLCERWDRQEQTRHDDINGLQHEVQQTRLHCAGVLAERESAEEKRESDS